MVDTVAYLFTLHTHLPLQGLATSCNICSLQMKQGSVSRGLAVGGVIY